LKAFYPAVMVLLEVHNLPSVFHKGMMNYLQDEGY